MPNENLTQARLRRKDEFYTQMGDIERELQHYWPHFRDKVVLCNCDDPYESNFFKYFALNFNQLGLKKLICTCFDGSPVQGLELQLPFEWEPEADELAQAAEPASLYGGQRKSAYKVEISEVKDMNGDGAVDLSDVQYLLKNDKNAISLLKQHGDFRSQECIELLKEADIVVTNPPFSLFREYVGQLMKYEKKFIIMGRMSALHYSEIFPLIMQNKLWSGFNFNISAVYKAPYENTLEANRKFVKSKGLNPDDNYIKVPAICWFTNLDISKRHEAIDLVCRYSVEEYPHYDNYDAIDVGRVQDIPFDYSGIMGVPDTILGQFNPEQFEIIGLGCGDLGKRVGVKKNYRGRTDLAYTLEGKHKCPYSRILIRNKHPKTL